MVRSGHEAAVDRWIDRYRARLEDAPAPSRRTTADDWREALGDPSRLGDWPTLFADQLSELAQALGDWAARWQPVPRAPLTGRLGPANGLRGVPGLPPDQQRGGIDARLAQHDDIPGWMEAQGALAAFETDAAVDVLRRPRPLRGTAGRGADRAAALSPRTR